MSGTNKAPAQVGPYKTTDVKFAAFLRAKKVHYTGHRKLGTSPSSYCEFHFEANPAEVQSLLLHFKNKTEEAQVDARTLLEEYEDLKGSRYT